MIYNHSLCVVVHLGPMAREHSQGEKGIKDIKVIGMENKWEVVICVLLATNKTCFQCNYFLHVTFIYVYPSFCLQQIIWTMTFTSQFDIKSLVKSKDMPTICLSNSCSIYRTKVWWKEWELLLVNQKFVWLLGSQSLHKSNTFFLWMKKEFPLICLLFVLANFVFPNYNSQM